MERNIAGDPSTMRRAVAAAPREPAARDRLLARSDRLLRLTPDEAAEELAWLWERVTITGSGMSTWLRDHSLCTSLVTPILDRLADSRRSIGRLRITGRRAVDTAQVPQLIWSETWRELRPHIASSEDTGRCFASMALVKMTSGATWSSVGEALGLMPELARHVSRKGKLALLDEQAFAAILQNASANRPIDWRHREHQALAVMGDEVMLVEIAAFVGAAHVEPCLMRERVWSQWAGGHPTVPRTAWPASKKQRARAANQRRRWQPENTARLDSWLQEQLGPDSDGQVLATKL